MPDLTTFEWLLVCSTVAGPVLAVQAQKFVERARERRMRKLHVFHTLMATRAARLSPGHVEALNMIDIEFYGRKVLWLRFPSPKEKAVVDSWHVYQDHLNTQDIAPDAIRLWIQRGDELFTDLLLTMSIALGYDFDRVRLKRGIYSPRAHGEQENAQIQIRDHLVKVLSGETPLQMAVTSFPTTTDALERYQKVQEAILAALSGDQPIKVKIEAERSIPK